MLFNRKYDVIRIRIFFVILSQEFNIFEFFAINNKDENKQLNFSIAHFLFISIMFDNFFYLHLFVRYSCHYIDWNAIGRNRLSINTGASPSFDKLRRDFWQL